MSRRRAALLAAVWLGPSLILSLVAWSVYARYHIDVPPRIDADARAAAMAPLRAAVDGTEPQPIRNPALSRRLPDRGPVVVGVWSNGKMIARVVARGDTAAAAIGSAATALAEHTAVRELSAGARTRARIKVDLVVGRGPLLRPGDFLGRVTGGVLSGLAIHPGIEGVGAELDGKDVVLLPDELVRGRVFMAATPMKAVPDVKVGLDFALVDGTLQKLSGMEPGVWAGTDKRFVRIRTDGFIEAPAPEQGSRAILPLTRGLPPPPALTADNLRAAALSGARYLVAHLAANGRYVYQQELSSGKATDPTRPGAYSIPRHAGATYFLAQAYRITGESFLREPIERAFAHLGELVKKGGCQGTLPGGHRFACVIDENPALERRLKTLARAVQAAPAGRDRQRAEAELARWQRRRLADLGSTALAVVALAEYERATGKQTYRDLAARLTEWILSMQRPDGSFRHLYVVPTGERVESSTLLYYSGEAALALARMYLVTREERYRLAAKRAVDWLVDWYDFFVGGFIYGEEHWTCIAAEALWPAVKEERYRDFCSGYSRFLRAQQVQRGDFADQADLSGAYNVSPFVQPHNTPAGSRTEAMISTYLLGLHAGHPDPAIRAQILAADQYVLAQQIRPESAWDVDLRAHGLGAMPGSPIDRMVRIDYIQHTCSALIRSIQLLEPGPGAGKVEAPLSGTTQ